MDGNAKSDLEHTAERTVHISGKGGKILTVFFSGVLIKVTHWYHKHFSSSMKALKKDGQTKELFVSPPLTLSEAKQIIASARENDILMGVKKMQPDGEYGANKSLHQQEKIAHNEIKYQKWNERCKSTTKYKLINQFCKNKANKYKNLSLKDELNKDDERYVVIVNKSRVAFLNEQLAKIPEERVKRLKSNDLDNITLDNLDERVIEPMVSRGMNLTVDALSKVGEDFGSCLVRDYQKDYCIQKITKEQYCEIREQLFELKSHGAKVYPNGEVMVAINSDDLEEYKKFAPLDKPIKEFGSSGAKDLETQSNDQKVIGGTVFTEEEFSKVREKYKDKDFMAIHNQDGSILFYVREKDTQQMVDDAKKKSSTAELLKEANDFAEEKDTSKDVEPVIDLEEEREIDS